MARSTKVSVFRKWLGHWCVLLLRIARWWTSALKKKWLRALYPGIQIGSGTYVSILARLAMTDGGQLTIGDRCYISRNVMIRCNGARLQIGNDCFIGQNAVIASGHTLTIGNDCLIAEGVTIRDQDHGTRPGELYRCQPPTLEPVRICNNVWLGAQAVILKGVTVEDNAIVGASSVVTKDVLEGEIACGVPARSLKRSPQDLASKRSDRAK